MCSVDGFSQILEYKNVNDILIYILLLVFSYSQTEFISCNERDIQSIALDVETTLACVLLCLIILRFSALLLLTAAYAAKLKKNHRKEAFCHFTVVETYNQEQRHHLSTSLVNLTV